MPDVVKGGQLWKEPAPGGGRGGAAEDGVFEDFIFFKALLTYEGFFDGE